MTDRTKVLNVLFVCKGNSDRSPTAEELFDNWDGKWKAKSAGIDPSPGRNPLTEELIVWADLILAMQAEHKQFISARFRNDADKVRVLDIPDSYRRGDTQLIEELKRKVAPVLETSEFMQEFAGLCALPYHEARYVRVLFGIEDPRAKNYSKLFDLPRNRYEAWAQLDRTLRRKAKYAETASQARRVFEQQFELSLQDLVILFKNPGWKGKRVGGKPWEDITSKVIELSVALYKCNLNAARGLALELMKMEHHSGSVCDKLRDLDQALAARKYTGQAQS